MHSESHSDPPPSLLSARERNELINMFGFAFLLIETMWGWHRLRSAKESRRIWFALEGVETATSGVRDSTSAVEAAVCDLNIETSRLQHLAIVVGVVTAMLGAVVGGIAGAVAAHVIR